MNKELIDNTTMSLLAKNYKLNIIEGAINICLWMDSKFQWELWQVESIVNMIINANKEE